MNAKSLEEYLHEHIPLSKAMQVGVVSVEQDAVTLNAPLAPNINHIGTAFGGSESAIAILAAWSLLNVRIENSGLTCTIIIQRHSIEFVLPIPLGFTARAHLTNSDDWERFIRTLANHGRARINITSVIEYGMHHAASFEGDFVAIKSN